MQGRGALHTVLHPKRAQAVGQQDPACLETWAGSSLAGLTPRLAQSRSHRASRLWARSRGCGLQVAAAAFVWPRQPGGTDGWTDGWRDRRTDGRMDEWTDGRMEGQMDGRIDDGWVDGCCGSSPGACAPRGSQHNQLAAKAPSWEQRGPIVAIWGRSSLPPPCPPPYSGILGERGGEGKPFCGARQTLVITFL